MLNRILKSLVKVLPFCLKWYYNEKRLRESLLIKLGDKGIRIVNGATLISCHFEVTNHLPFPVSIDRLEAKLNLTGYIENGVKLMPILVGENSTQYYPLDISVSERNEQNLNSIELKNNHLQVDCYLVTKIRNLTKTEYYSSFKVTK